MIIEKIGRNNPRLEEYKLIEVYTEK